MIDVEARMCYGPAYGGVTDVATLTARDVASQFILRDLPTLATLGHLPNLATPTSSAGGTDVATLTAREVAPPLVSHGGHHGGITL